MPRPPRLREREADTPPSPPPPPSDPSPQPEGRGAPSRRTHNAEGGGTAGITDAPTSPAGPGLARPPSHAPLRLCPGLASAPPPGGGGAGEALPPPPPGALRPPRSAPPPSPGEGVGAVRGGVGTARARGGRCLPRDGPSGGARPWAAPPGRRLKRCGVSGRRLKRHAPLRGVRDPGDRERDRGDRRKDRGDRRRRTEVTGALPP